MRKILLLTILFASSFISAQSQSKWNRPVQLKSCYININANQFTATTFIEMEFYNPNNSELEGYYQFNLNPGQVITAFQLMLNGKYRDGSIEEKWKATNAYNTIVGKRVDPALLTMDYANHYSIHVYPVPAKGSRFVTMTIQQELVNEKDNLLYSLPMNVTDTVGFFKLQVNVHNSDEAPSAFRGVGDAKTFIKSLDEYALTWTATGIFLKNPLSFSIPLSSKFVLCSKRVKENTFFALRYKPTYAQEYEVHPEQLTVFWDVSGSLGGRDIKREISFLKQFVAYHSIKQLTIVSFNYRLLDTAVFYTDRNFNSHWEKYLDDLDYKGPLQLGSIDFTGLKDDMYMIFSDGRNTYGKSIPKTGTALVYCVSSSPSAELNKLYEIVGSNGGKVVELDKLTMSSAIGINSKAENWLLNVRSTSGKVITEQTFPIKLDDYIMVNGTMPNSSDTLLFEYGNNNNVVDVQQYILLPQMECASPGIERMYMLNRFDDLIKGGYGWSQMIDYGLLEKIVTPNTAYIVLEKVEDYVKYNITPPKELEKECEQMNYVRKDTRSERLMIAKANEVNNLNYMINFYNVRISQWDGNESRIQLKTEDLDKIESVNQSGSVIAEAKTKSAEAFFDGGRIGENSEVVVTTSLGIKRRPRELGYAQSTINAKELTTTHSPFLGQALSGKVAGLTIYNTDNSVTPSSRIVLRGNRSITGNNTALIVLDGVPVPNSAINYLNTNDIETVSVLKGGQASAIYGSEGVNGALIITTKKGSYSYRESFGGYKRLENLMDVDYIHEIKSAGIKSKMRVYKALEQEYKNAPGFYFDMAQHLFDSGLKGEANGILMEAAEAANGSVEAQRAMGFVFESWKEFDEAIKIYQQLVDNTPSNLVWQRDLALAYLQNGQYQKAIDVLYAAIAMKNNSDVDFSYNFNKGTMLLEMNAIIAMYKDQLDISFIPASLIKPLPVDLRITLDCNTGYIHGLSIREPGGEICNDSKTITKNGGTLASWYQYYNSNIYATEYQIKKAIEGNYKISVSYYSYYANKKMFPSFIRMMVFRNFGKKNQSIEIENVIMDNQNGQIEIGEVKW